VKKNKYIISILILGFPLVAFAAGKTLHDLVSSLAMYLNDALALLMGLSVLLFVWYIIKYFIQPSPDTKRTEAAQYVMWSFIGFFVIFSIWGIVNILISTFDLGTVSPRSWIDIDRLFPKS
jgi:hypothetical protein